MGTESGAFLVQSGQQPQQLQTEARIKAMVALFVTCLHQRLHALILSLASLPLFCLFLSSSPSPNALASIVSKATETLPSLSPSSSQSAICPPQSTEPCKVVAEKMPPVNVAAIEPKVKVSKEEESKVSEKEEHEKSPLPLVQDDTAKFLRNGKFTYSKKELLDFQSVPDSFKRPTTLPDHISICFKKVSGFKSL